MYKNTTSKPTNENFINGLTLSEIGVPLSNHSTEPYTGFEELFQNNGVKINGLPEGSYFSESSFAENIAVLTPTFVVMSNSEVPARMEEIFAMEPMLNSIYDKIYYIQKPGTLKSEDVLQIDQHFYIGVTEGTNLIGAQQLQQILQFENYKADIISHKELLDLKKVLHN